MGILITPEHTWEPCRGPVEAEWATRYAECIGAAAEAIALLPADQIYIYVPAEETPEEWLNRYADDCLGAYVTLGRLVRGPVIVSSARPELDAQLMTLPALLAYLDRRRTAILSRFQVPWPVPVA